jgi:hypothetical protein
LAEQLAYRDVTAAVGPASHLKLFVVFHITGRLIVAGE